MGKWFGKDEVEVPPELEKMTPDQILAAAKEAESLRTRVSEIDVLKAKIAEMEANPKTIERIVEKPIERRGQAPNDPPAPISFLEDENAAFNQRAAPIVNAVLSTSTMISKMTFENGLGGVDKRMYNKFGKEVEELMSKEPAQNQASPYSWKTAWDIIKGRHTEDIAKAASDKTDFFSEVATGDPNAGPVKNADPNTLSDEEKKVAAKYGLDEKAYLESKKGMTVYHG